MGELAAEAKPGLRDRKKARRRGEIIAAARELFGLQGIDATTIADIAAAAGVSALTVFNYFGSKDGILIAMISEGTREARERDRDLHWRDGADLLTLVVDLFHRISSRTLDVAGKRVWRYAEAAAIRHPEASLSQEHRNLGVALHGVVAGFLGKVDLPTRARVACPPDELAALLIDLWMPCFLRLITTEDHSLADHRTVLGDRLGPLLRLLFTDDAINHPRRKDAHNDL